MDVSTIRKGRHLLVYCHQYTSENVDYFLEGDKNNLTESSHLNVYFSLMSLEGRWGGCGRTNSFLCAILLMNITSMRVGFVYSNQP